MVQFLKYFLVGGTAAIIDITCFSLLATILGWDYRIANSISFTLGLLLLYLGTYKWVFHKERIDILRDFIPFTLVGLIGLPIQNVLLYFLLDWHWAETGFRLFAAASGFSVDLALVNTFSKIFVAGVSFLGNFLARKFLVFERRNKQPIPQESVKTDFDDRIAPAA